jgi:hypothetical protein
MPILDDIMDHDLLGPIFRDGEQQDQLTNAYDGRGAGDLIDSGLW